MDKAALERLIVARLEGTSYCLVTCQVSPTNDILVEVDSLSGVDLDFCAGLNQYLVEQIEVDATLRGGMPLEAFDYSLEVGSVSLTAPFKTRMQYEKNLGHEIEVIAADGRKYTGQLISVDEDSFSLESAEMVIIEGKKHRQRQLITRTFAYADVKQACYNLKV